MLIQLLALVLVVLYIQGLTHSSPPGQKKVAIVTGANKGIGYEICKKLGAAGVRIILACRNESLGIEAEASLKKLGYDVEYRNLDIADDQSIARFTQEISVQYRHIDILVNNAGIAYKMNDTRPYAEQAASILMTNFFGTMRFTESMLSLLRQAQSPRIVNVSSQAGKLKIIKSDALRARFEHCQNMEALNTLVIEYLKAVQDNTYAQKGWPHANYGISKLALNALTRILAQRELQANPKKNFLINAATPGFCATDLNFHKGPRTPEHGARTPAMLALLSEVGPMAPTGKFFYDEAEVEW